MRSATQPRVTIRRDSQAAWGCPVVERGAQCSAGRVTERLVDAANARQTGTQISLSLSPSARPTVDDDRGARRRLAWATCLPALRGMSPHEGSGGVSQTFRQRRRAPRRQELQRGRPCCALPGRSATPPTTTCTASSSATTFATPSYVHLLPRARDLELTIGPPEDELAVGRREGWIHVSCEPSSALAAIV